jgi:hypothetical protein
MPTLPAKIDFHKARDFGETLNVSFLFVRQHFKGMMLGMLFIAGPFVLVGSVIPILLFSRLSGGVSASEDFVGPGSGNWLVNAGASMLVNVLALLLGMVMAIGVIYEYILLYYRRGDQPGEIETGELWQAIRRDFWRLLGVNFGLVLLLGFGAFCLNFVAVLLGTPLGAFGVFFLLCGAFFLEIYLAVPLTLVVITSLHERINLFEALTRAFYLVKGYWWQTFGLILICVLMQYALLLLCMVPFMIVGFTSEMFTEMGTSLGSTVVFALCISIAITMIITLSFCLFLTVSAFQYFSLVERKESVGLRQKIESMGTDALAATRDFYADEEEHY